MSERIIIDKTPFIFEDGKTYYFEIKSRISSNDYHNLSCFEKIKKIRKFLFIKIENFEYRQIGNDSLININLNKEDVERELKKIINANTINAIKGWDGFVGNIPDNIRKSSSRNSKLKDILD